MNERSDIERRLHAQEERIAQLERRLERRLDAFQASLDAIRSDVIGVALAVEVTPRADRT